MILYLTRRICLQIKDDPTDPTDLCYYIKKRGSLVLQRSAEPRSKKITMPKRKRGGNGSSRKRGRRSSRRLRWVRRRRRRRRRKRRVPLGIQPKNRIVKLRYHTTITLEPDALNFTKKTLTSNNQVWLFGANCMYDPDISGTGHQPRGFDQVITSQSDEKGGYIHYTVVGSKISVRPIGPQLGQNTSNAPAVFGVNTIPDSQWPYDNYNDMVESGITGKIIQKDMTLTRPYSAFWSARRAFGKKVSGMIGKTAYSGDKGDNPIEKQYFAVWCTSPAFGHSMGDPPTYYFRVIIDYVAVCTEPCFLEKSF